MRQRTGIASNAEQAAFRHGGGMATEIIELLSGRGGRATSKEIIAHFQGPTAKSSLGGPREMALFKQLLKQLATLDKQTKEWVLKAE